ncbi:MAG: cobyric acid synthase [Acidimicrobiales bacterium]
MSSLGGCGSGALAGAVMICGTASDVGKTALVTGLCRMLAARGVRVAPFKGQNMALNSFVTPAGAEIGRAQGIQALAAGVEAEAAMNPILLKPTGERTSQVVVMGRPIGHFDAAGYQSIKVELWPIVNRALDDLRRRFDVVVLEGAGSAAEINLIEGDLVNLRLAEANQIPAVVVGDIDRGGVFAALYGTVALLPRHLQAQVAGLIINKFRGDPALLGDGPAQVSRLTGVPFMGTVPWITGMDLDAEDSLALPRSMGPPPNGLPRPPASGPAPPADGGPSEEASPECIDVAVVRFPRISNFTDLDPLATERSVRVRFVERVAQLGRPDLVVLPGTKATVADLDWLRATGLDRAVAASTAVVLGVCGGYQMMGRSIDDPVESGRGRVPGLGWLSAATVFGPEKVTRQRRGRALGQRVAGYEIHHGLTRGDNPWIDLDDAWGRGAEGSRSGRYWGTSLHGILEADGFRREFLARVRPGFAGGGPGFAPSRQARIDRLAAVLASSLDIELLEATIRRGSSIQHDAVQHDAVQHDAVQHDAVQHDAVQHEATRSGR